MQMNGDNTPFHGDVLRPDDMSKAEMQSGSTDPTIEQRIKQQFNENEELQDALTESGLPRRFQAMVLGLATIKQMNDDR